MASRPLKGELPPGAHVGRQQWNEVPELEQTILSVTAEMTGRDALLAGGFDDPAGVALREFARALRDSILSEMRDSDDAYAIEAVKRVRRELDGWTHATTDEERKKDLGPIACRAIEAVLFSIREALKARV